MSSLIRRQLRNSKVLRYNCSRLLSSNVSRYSNANNNNKGSYYSSLASISILFGFSTLVLMNDKTYADNAKKNNVIDGKAIANQIHVELAQSVKEIQKNYGVTPGLAVILVGERKDSQSYVKSKKKACADIGMTSFGYDYPADVTEAELLKKIDELNAGIFR